MHELNSRLENTVDKATGSNYRLWRKTVTSATVIVVAAGFLNWALNSKDSLDETVFFLMAGLLVLAQLRIISMRKFIFWAIVDPKILEKLEETQ